MSEKAGCLGGAALAVGAVLLAPLLALFALLKGRPTGDATDRPRLPYLAISRMNGADRPALQSAQKAAERCMEILYGPGSESDELGEEVAGEVSSEILGLLERIHEIGQRLAEARGYVKRHDIDAIARQQADLELRVEEAHSLEERSSLKEAMAALEERARHAATVGQEIRSLSARLTAAANGPETLAARLARGVQDPDQGTTGSQTALRDVREQQDAVGRALDAYAATARELNNLR